MTWIKTSDRLPEEGQEINFTKHMSNGTAYVVSGIYHKPKDNTFLYRLDGFTCWDWSHSTDFSYDASEIKYWMPLPEAPSELD